METSVEDRVSFLFNSTQGNDSRLFWVNLVLLILQRLSKDTETKQNKTKDKFKVFKEKAKLRDHEISTVVLRLYSCLKHFLFYDIVLRRFLAKRLNKFFLLSWFSSSGQRLLVAHEQIKSNEKLKYV